MDLLPEIDEKATIANVRKFFDKDFPRLQVMAHISYVDIKSPIITGMPSQQHYGNLVDDKLTAYANANALLDRVLDACRSMRHPHREFMEKRYFKNMSWLMINQSSGYSPRRCQQIINEAFLQFAEAFQDTEDFRVFK
ncbi:ArpU family phage packaging/lysis transcriptional regulator [Pediococcus pentosaceus]